MKLYDNLFRLPDALGDEIVRTASLGPIPAHVTLPVAWGKVKRETR
jgi:hypothetical protein